jgi:hypothetical protein
MRAKRVKTNLITIVALFLVISTPVFAREIAGVTVPGTLSMGHGGKRLTLNGAGIRYKWFFKIYVCALYLPHRANTGDAVVAMEGPKVVTMHFLYDEVAAEKLRAAWKSGFRDNSTQKEYAAIAPRVQRFNQLFHDTKRGDEIRLEYRPGEGTEVLFNGQSAGRIEGRDFNAALLRIWLGKVPADFALKDALLGIDD